MRGLFQQNENISSESTTELNQCPADQSSGISSCKDSIALAGHGQLMWLRSFIVKPKWIYQDRRYKFQNDPEDWCIYHLHDQLVLDSQK